MHNLFDAKIKKYIPKYYENSYDKVLITIRRRFRFFTPVKLPQTKQTNRDVPEIFAFIEFIETLTWYCAVLHLGFSTDKKESTSPNKHILKQCSTLRFHILHVFRVLDLCSLVYLLCRAYYNLMMTYNLFIWKAVTFILPAKFCNVEGWKPLGENQFMSLLTYCRQIAFLEWWRSMKWYGDNSCVVGFLFSDLNVWVWNYNTQARISMD